MALKRSKRARVGGPRGDRDRALAGRGQERVDVEHGAGPMLEAETPEAGEREQRRADLARFGLAQPRFDIARRSVGLRSGRSRSA